MIATMTCTAPGGAATGARIAKPSSTASNATALVFVHGVGSTAAIWDMQLEAFGDAFACVAIELRGNGVPKPDPDPASITRAGFASDVIAVLDALNIENFTLVGCSLGGIVAFELWERVPQRVDAMVIADSFARYPEGERYADGVADAVRKAGSMREFAQARATQLGLPPQRLAETIEQMACKSVPSYLAATQATWTGDYTPILSSITVPSLIACGERDLLTPWVLSEEIAAGIPSSQLAEVPDAGHVSNADNPAAFNRLLRNFLTEAVLSP